LIIVRRHIFIVTTVLVLLCSGFVGKNPQIVHEYELKSATLFKICNYVTWPAPRDDNQTFDIVVIGTPEEIARFSFPSNKLLNNKAIRLIGLDDYLLIDDCQVLFICQSKLEEVSQILEFIQDKNILTFSDNEALFEQGVMINFYVDENRVKFELNPEVISRSNIKLHSQLYSIGKIKNKQSN